MAPKTLVLSLAQSFLFVCLVGFVFFFFKFGLVWFVLDVVPYCSCLTKLSSTFSSVLLLLLSWVQQGKRGIKPA